MQDPEPGNRPFFRAPEHLIRLILIHQQPFVRIRNRGDRVHPLPVRRNIGAAQEIPTEQEEESRERNHRSVTQDVIRHHGAHEHDKGIGREQRDVEDQQEVVKRPAELEGVPDNGGVDGRLQQQEREAGTASFDEKKKRQTVKMKKLRRLVIPWRSALGFMNMVAI
ncbi:unnamed protein product, partial [Linum tenue]